MKRREGVIETERASRALRRPIAGPDPSQALVDAIRERGRDDRGALRATEGCGRRLSNVRQRLRARILDDEAKSGVLR